MTKENRKCVSLAFEAAGLMAERKEQLIKAAITHYFGDEPWSEEILAGVAAFDIYPDHEVFRIYETPLIKFWPIETDISITGTTVKATYRQNYQVLYGD